MSQTNNAAMNDDGISNGSPIRFEAAPLARLVSDAIKGQEAFRVGKLAVCEAFKGLTFDAFTGRHEMVTKALVSGGFSDNADSAKRMLNRMLDDCGVEKPKSESAEAVKKAEARKAEKTAEAKKLASVVSAAKKEAGKGADELAVRKIIAEKAATGDQVATKALAQINEAAREMAKIKNAEMLKAIKAELANASTDTLQQIAILLKIKS